MYKLKVLLVANKCKKMWKKSYQENSKYSLQYRTDYLVSKIKSLMKSLKIEIVVKGYENLGNSGPCMLYGNHQDNFDALAIVYALAAQTKAKDDFNKIPTFIAKHSLQYKSYTRYPLNCLDTFFLDRDDVKKSLETYDKYGRFVKENKTYGVIFPEGTRNREGKIGEFKPGSFKVAKKELMPIIPFTLNNTVGAFDKDRKDVLKVEVIFHKKISAMSLTTQNTIAIAERVQKIVESSFVKPQYEFKTSEAEDENIEESKAAKRWWKKEAKRQKKEAEKERKIREQERKIEEAQKKEDERYEKSIRRKEEKTKKNK